MPGHGKPLQLDDDSAVPAELRTGYRLLKNAGYLPAELQDRKDALQLADLLKTLDEDDPCVAPLDARLRLLELKLRQAGMSTDFLHQHYQQQLRARFFRSGRSECWIIFPTNKRKAMNDNYRHTKGAIQDNALAALLHDPLFRQRREKNKKGKGSYSRKNQSKGNWEASGKRILGTIVTGFLYRIRAMAGKGCPLTADKIFRV